MTRTIEAPIVADRRQLLIGGAAALVLAHPGRSAAEENPASAEAPPAPPPAAAPAAEAAEPSGSPQFQEALKTLIGDAKPLEERVTVDIPEDVENGNIVPYKLSVESPMTDADSIARLHLLSTENPQASVATFHFTALSGKAAVTGRMRLAKTQDVVAVAETSAGGFLIGRRNVKVAIGGCGSE